MTPWDYIAECLQRFYPGPPEDAIRLLVAALLVISTLLWFWAVVV